MPTVTTCRRTVPQVVGAAGKRMRNKTRAIPTSPAEKAAALSREATGPRRAPTTTRSSSPRTAPARAARRSCARTLGGLVVAAILGGGGYAAWAWSQKQYFVAADGGHVAIFRGVSQDLGPISLSHVESQSDVLVSDLPSDVQGSVGNTIPARDLADAAGQGRRRCAPRHMRCQQPRRRRAPRAARRPDADAVHRARRRRPTTPPTRRSRRCPTPRPSTSPRPTALGHDAARRRRCPPHRGRWSRDDDRRAADPAHASRGRAGAAAPRDRHRAARVGHDRPQPQRHGAGQHHPDRRRLHRPRAGRAPRAAVEGARTPTRCCCRSRPCSTGSGSS